MTARCHVRGIDQDPVGCFSCLKRDCLHRRFPHLVNGYLAGVGDHDYSLFGDVLGLLRHRVACRQVSLGSGAACLSSTRRVLPLVVLGSSCTNSISRGYL